MEEEYYDESDYWLNIVKPPRPRIPIECRECGFVISKHVETGRIFVDLANMDICKDCWVNEKAKASEA